MCGRETIAPDVYIYEKAPSSRGVWEVNLNSRGVCVCVCVCDVNPAPEVCVGGTLALGTHMIGTLALGLCGNVTLVQEV